jgi:hypothetical protein
LASGFATISGDAVTGVTMLNGGDYSSAPSVAFCGGGGSGADGTAVLTGRAVTSVTINSGGSNYSTAPSVLFGSSCSTGGGGGGGGGGGDTGALPRSSMLASAGASGFNYNIFSFLGSLLRFGW